MGDFLTFRRMLMPYVIEITFWVGLIGAIVFGFVALAYGIHGHHGRDEIAGMLIILFGPLVIRLYAEMLIVFFRMNETLTDLRALAVWAAERAHGYDSDAREDDEDTLDPFPSRAH